MTRSPTAATAVQRSQRGVVRPLMRSESTSAADVEEPRAERATDRVHVLAGPRGCKLGASVRPTDKDRWQMELATDPVTPGYYRHFKTNSSFIVFAQTANEETGEILIHYFSVLQHRRWTRPKTNFLEHVNGRPRFAWWRPATINELTAAAFGGAEEIRRVFGHVQD